MRRRFLNTGVSANKELSPPTCILLSYLKRWSTMKKREEKIWNKNEWMNKKLRSVLLAFRLFYIMYTFSAWDKSNVSFVRGHVTLPLFAAAIAWRVCRENDQMRRNNEQLFTHFWAINVTIGQHQRGIAFIDRFTRLSTDQFRNRTMSVGQHFGDGFQMNVTDGTVRIFHRWNFIKTSSEKQSKLKRERTAAPISRSYGVFKADNPLCKTAVNLLCCPIWFSLNKSRRNCSINRVQRFSSNNACRQSIPRWESNRNCRQVAFTW